LQACSNSSDVLDIDREIRERGIKGCAWI